MSAVSYYHSPLGWIEIRASQDAVTSVTCCGERKKENQGGSEILTECIRQLDEYFNGQRTHFDIPVNQEGTDFQKRVWKALTDIPFGKTVSYGYVAKMLNHPKASRAVGAANGRNKVWIIVPCHRVIGADGSLTGYSGGIEIKKWLLAHEAQVLKKHNTLPKNL